MALPNLSGSNIQDTYQRVLHTDGSTLYDGTGSIASTINLNVNGLIADGDAFFNNPAVFQDSITMQGDINLEGDVSASGTITAGDIVNHSNTTSGLRFNQSSTDVLSNLIVSGSITASGDISSSGDIIGQNFTAHDVLSTSFTGSVDNPAIRLGPLTGNPAGNKVGIMLEDFAPPANIMIPWFVSNGVKVFGFGSYMDMRLPIYMGNNKIVFDADAANTFIHADMETPENLEIHADGNLELRAQDDLQVYSDVDITGAITASGNISASGDLFFNNIDGGTF